MPVDRGDIERLKEIFITRQECDTITDDINSKLANDDKRLAVIDTKVTAILWGVGVIIAAVIGVMVKLLFGVG